MSSAEDTRPTGRSSRLNMRISPDALDTLREAAAAQGIDVTSFVLGAAMEHARDVLLKDKVLRLSPEGMAQMEVALDAEPQVIPELAALIQEVRGKRVASVRSVSAQPVRA